MTHDPMTVAALLEHEAAFPRHNGRKERATRKRFGVGPVRYYQALDVALNEHREVALQLEPVLVNRLLNLRHDRTTDRNSRILGRTNP